MAYFISKVKSKYKKVIIGIHNVARAPAKNFGISDAAIALAGQLTKEPNSILFVFGNPYCIKNFCSAENLVACYEDDDITQGIAADFLQKKIFCKWHIASNCLPSI